MMSTRSGGKAGVDVWLFCVWATNVCCRAKAGGAVVAMTSGRAIGLIVQVCLLAAVAAERP